MKQVFSYAMAACLMAGCASLAGAVEVRITGDHVVTKSVQAKVVPGTPTDLKVYGVASVRCGNEHETEDRQRERSGDG